MIGTITFKGLNKNQKMTVHIDGKVYYPGRLDVSGIQVGDKLDFNAVAFGAKGDLWGLQSWKLLEGATKYPASSTPNPIVNSSPAPSQTVTGVMDVERPAISNWIAAAIAAGLIKDRADLGLWIIAARDALRQ
jgi:hypothetical protein